MSEPTLDAIDQQELNRLQGEVNAYRECLKEFDRVTATSTDDIYVQTLIKGARGKILAEINLRKTLWGRYILREPRDVRDEAKVDLLDVGEV